MGSLGTDTNISNIEYENIYTYNSTQMYMIKSNGGNGTVTNCSFKNFIGYSNAYMLDLDTYWGDQSDGDGIKYENIGFEVCIICSQSQQRPESNPSLELEGYQFEWHSAKPHQDSLPGRESMHEYYPNSR